MAAEQRANIKFCLKLGNTAREAYEMKKSVYGSDCSHSNIFRWYAVFCDGREDNEDAPRTSKPRTSRTEKNVKKVTEILASDRCVSARLIENLLGIPKSSVHQILSPVKTLLTIFLDSKGIIHKEFLPEGQTVNAHYYLGVLNRLWARILQIRPEYREQGSWSLFHDNAPTHKTSISA